jgi:hypothetical protein
MKLYISLHSMNLNHFLMHFSVPRVDQLQFRNRKVVVKYVVGEVGVHIPKVDQGN